MGSEPDGPSGAAPWTVRAAGLGVVAQGLVLIGVAVFFLLSVGAVFGVWGFFVLAGGGLAVLGGALVMGRRGARSPVIVMQILLLGVAYYAAVPSARPQVGVPLALVAGAIMAGLLLGPAKAWAAR